MARKAVWGLAVFLVAAAAAATQAAADGPIAWEVRCTGAAVPVPLIALQPQEIGDRVATCHALGGRVAGVRPIFE